VAYTGCDWFDHGRITRKMEKERGGEMKVRYLLVALIAVSLVGVPTFAQDTCATAVVAGTPTEPCNDLTPTGPLGSCTSGGGTLDSWNSFMATATSARIRTDLSSAGTDSDYIVYSSSDNTCGGILTEIACSEDDVGFNGDIAVVNLTIGNTYFDFCPNGPYVVDVIQPSDGPICGDNDVNAFGEECDGTDSAACGEAACQGDCTCPTPVCGNGLTEAGEECDGASDAGCILSCQLDCTCEPLDTPALPIGGIVGLGLLLVGGGAVAFRRHRKSA
jgi:hypothetical protein